MVSFKNFQNYKKNITFELCLNGLKEKQKIMKHKCGFICEL